GAARAHGIRDERPEFCVSRLSTGETRCASAHASRTRSRFAGASSRRALHRNALPERCDARGDFADAQTHNAVMRGRRFDVAERDDRAADCGGMAQSRHWSICEATRAVRHARLTLAPLLPLSAARVLDVALEHPVFEALLLQDGLGDIVKRLDAL